VIAFGTLDLNRAKAISLAFPYLLLLLFARLIASLIVSSSPGLVMTTGVGVSFPVTNNPVYKLPFKSPSFPFGDCFPLMILLPVYGLLMIHFSGDSCFLS
jgi:hypothetical protein